MVLLPEAAPRTAAPARAAPSDPSGAAPPGRQHPAPAPGGDPESGQNTRLQRLGRVLLWIGLSLGLCACLAAAAVLLVVQHYSEGLPSVEKLKSGYDPPQVT